jgi:hypothetical protein
MLFDLLPINADKHVWPDKSEGMVMTYLVTYSPTGRKVLEACLDFASFMGLNWEFKGTEQASGLFKKRQVLTIAGGTTVVSMWFDIVHVRLGA